MNAVIRWAIFLTLLRACFAFTYPWQWMKMLSDDNTNCKNRGFWENIYNKAKKEHPSAKIQDIVKAISKEIMEDSVHNPMFGIAIFVIEDHKDINNSDIVYQTEISGIFDEVLHLPEHWINYTECQLGNGFIMAMIPRNKFDQHSWLNHLFGKWNPRNSDFSNFIKKKTFQRLSKLENLQNSTVDCATSSEVQSAIDTINKMNITDNIEWSQKLAENLNATINMLDISTSKLELSNPIPLQNKASFIYFGTEKWGDFDYCDDPSDHPECFDCDEYDPVSNTMLSAGFYKRG